jgi:hypothetical protein
VLPLRIKDDPSARIGRRGVLLTTGYGGPLRAAAALLEALHLLCHLSYAASCWVLVKPSRTHSGTRLM